MNILFLLIIIFGLSAQDVSKKTYNNKVNSRGMCIFSAIISLFAALFFLITADGLDFNREFLLYSVGFGTTYAMGTVFSVLALGAGSLALTNLFISYSLIIPTFYGVIFLGDKTGVWFYVGIILLAISLFLITGKDKDAKINGKWLVFAFLAFIGNGFCTVAQKAEQIAFDGNYKSEFMIVALLICAVIMITIAFFKERKDVGVCLKKGVLWGALCGIANGTVNLFVMILSSRMPVAIMFPLISAGSIILTYILSRFVYGEKMNKLQFIGFLLGVCSVVFLNM